MLKFNKRTMIALYAMTELARTQDAALATGEIAERFHVSRHHLAKVLQQLVRGGLVETTRGAAGGHRLARAPKDITLSDVVTVFEGPHPGQHCLAVEPGDECELQRLCDLHEILAELDDQIRFTLQSISLKTLVRRSQRKTRGGAARPDPD